MAYENYNEGDSIILKHSQGYTLNGIHLISLDFVGDRVTYVARDGNSLVAMSDSFDEFDEITINLRSVKGGK